jgi:RNA polymerase sigma-70 factor (ECF subfamily)
MPNFGRSAEQGTPSPDRGEFDEAELVRRAQLGSAAAFEQLVVTRSPHLYRYLAIRLRDEGDAHDALQETLAAAWQGLPNLKHANKFWPWLVGIATRKAADAGRNRVPAIEHEIDVLGAADESVIEINQAIGSLPTHLREVLLVRYRLQLTEDEAAEALGVRVGTVKSRSARARKALIELLR